MSEQTSWWANEQFKNLIYVRTYSDTDTWQTQSQFGKCCRSSSNTSSNSNMSSCSSNNSSNISTRSLMTQPLRRSIYVCVFFERARHTGCGSCSNVAAATAMSRRQHVKVIANPDAAAPWPWLRWLPGRLCHMKARN